MSERSRDHTNDNSSSTSTTSSESVENSNELSDDVKSDFSGISSSISAAGFATGEPVPEYAVPSNNPSSRVQFRNVTRTPELPRTTHHRTDLHCDGVQAIAGFTNNSSIEAHAASTQRLEEELGNYQYESALIRTELAHEVELRQQKVQQLESRHRIELSTVERERNEALAELQNLQSSTTLNERKLHEKNILLQQKLGVTTEELSRVRDELAECRQSKRLQAQCHSTAIITRDTDLANEKAVAGAARTEAVKLQEELVAEKQRCDHLRIQLQDQTSLQRQVEDVQRQCRDQVGSAQAEIEQLQQELHRQQQQHRDALQELEEKLWSAQEAALAARRDEGAREAELLSQLEVLRELKQKADSQVLQLKEQLLNAQQAAPRSSADIQYRTQPRPPMLQQVQQLTDQLHQLQMENTTLKLSEKEHDETAAELKSAKDQMISLKKQLAQLKCVSADQQHTISSLEKDLSVCREELKEAREGRKDSEESLSRELRQAREETATRRTQFLEEISNLTSRIQVLESRLMERDQKYHADTKHLKTKCSKYGSLIHKLRHRLQTSDLQQEQLQARLEALQTNWVDPVQFSQLRQELKLLLSKHAEFRAFVRGVQGARVPEEMSELIRRATFLGDRLTALEQQLNRQLGSTSETREAGLRSTSETREARLPGTSETREAGLHGTSETREAGLPGTSETREAGLPGTSETREAGLPGTSETREAGLHGTSETHDAGLRDTSGERKLDLFGVSGTEDIFKNKAGAIGIKTGGIDEACASVEIITDSREAGVGIEASGDSSANVARDIEASGDSSANIARDIEASGDSSANIARDIEPNGDSSANIARGSGDAESHTDYEGDDFEDRDMNIEENIDPVSGASSAAQSTVSGGSLGDVMSLSF
ncbi:hypothetical protein FHG87_003224 [Trinorchestia longiramus]|nr:hypothetical protein FHG87_003224 [Trinorchestia longiramus]